MIKCMYCEVINNNSINYDHLRVGVTHLVKNHKHKLT